MYFLLKMVDIPASYVSLPEGNINTHKIIQHNSETIKLEQAGLAEALQAASAPVDSSAMLRCEKKRGADVLLYYYALVVSNMFHFYPYMRR